MQALGMENRPFCLLNMAVKMQIRLVRYHVQTQNLPCAPVYSSIVTYYPRIFASTNTHPTSPQRIDFEKLRNKTMNTLEAHPINTVNNHVHENITRINRSYQFAVAHSPCHPEH